MYESEEGVEESLCVNILAGKKIYIPIPLAVNFVNPSIVSIFYCNCS